MYQIDAAGWIIRATAAGALFVGFCALITPMTRDIPSLPPLTKADAAQPALSRYKREQIPDIVLVGSSLTFRLNESYFLPLQVRNLAISGDSSLTGLQIIASYPRIPSLILVEANVMSRGVDASLVKQFSAESRNFLIMRPVRTAVAYFASRSRRSLEPASALEGLLNRPSEDHNNSDAIERAIEEFGKSTQDSAIKNNVGILRQLISELTAKGGRVYLFELPYPEKIETTHYVETTRTAVHEMFPDPRVWLHLSFSKEELRFEDHAHLDERSALIVARSMDREIGSLRQ